MQTNATRITLLAFCLLLAVPGGAKDFWLEKDYREWSQRDCARMLQDSPWVKDYTIADVVIEPLETERTDRGREDNPRITYRVRFNSAWPVRQAQVRLAQIQMNYDKLNAEQQASFDQQAEQFLNIPFTQGAAVLVSFGSNVPLYDRDLLQYWITMTLEQARNNIFLISGSGVRVPPAAFQLAEAGKQEFLLVFPREYEGRPLVQPGDKRLSLEFEHPSIGDLGARRVFVEFPVKKMVVDDVVVY